jgi:ribosomal protein S12 methylthiotransferase accessory factor
MGITRLANVTGLDILGIPVVMACRPNSRSVAVSQGKGLDLPAAKASAIMEAIEGFHGESVQSPLKLAAFEDLRYTHPIIDVDGLSASTNSRYDSRLPILWIEGSELVTGAPLWLPYEVVHTNYTIPAPTGSGCFVANSNGLASGNHILEAICHGICEVVERDATTLWKLQSDSVRSQAGLDLDTVDDDACRIVIQKFSDAGVDVLVWETTTDVSIASFQCLALGGADSVADPEFGAGCHPNPGIALLRALTEAAQARTTYITGARDDIGAGHYQASARTRRLKDCRALMADHQPIRNFLKIPSWEGESFADDLNEIVRRLQSVGLHQIAVVDLTKPAFGIPVVRVVIPGLEGAMEGPEYVPGARCHSSSFGDHS